VPTTYTFDVFSTLDGNGSYGPKGDWGGYWHKQGPGLLACRLALYEHEQHMVFGANTFRTVVEMIGLSADASEVDSSNVRMREMPATVVSSTLSGPFNWPDATIVSGDASS
jgi:hypothetical protein